MQISSIIVERVAINVVNDFTALCASDLAMFPFAAITLCAIPQTQIALLLARGVAVGSLNRSIGQDGNRDISGRSNHPIAAPAMDSGWKPSNLLLVGIERVAVLPVHLVMSPAHFLGDHWTITVQAGAANWPATPSIISRSMPLHALVVHKAKAVGGVFPVASSDVASLHAENDNTFQPTCPDKLTGKPVMRWIGERIHSVELLTSLREAA